jgi:predicted Zn-dependent protease
MNIQEILDQLDLKKFSCHFIDVRVERTQSSHFFFQNGELTSAGEKPVLGAFIRLYQNGSWFYSSTTAVTELETEIKKLLVLANANKPMANSYIVPVNNGIHHLINKVEDAFSKISLNEKVKLGESYLPFLILIFIKKNFISPQLEQSFHMTSIKRDLVFHAP